MLTLFTSAWLLFVVQPMFARMVLPLLGGSPAVWNVCVLFFQAGLLVGYLYAHWLTRAMRPARQVFVHAALLASPLAVLPIAIPSDLSSVTQGAEISWLLWLMVSCVGLPLVAVASSAPMLQRWFSLTDHPLADDPYFLYAASNAGSVAALLLYPVLIEPGFGIAAQSQMWSIVYGVLIILSVLCALKVRRGNNHAESQTNATTTSHQTVTTKQRMTWLLLAFIPSSLMLGATTYITTDIAVVPLLWVVPLGLYLISFIIAFARRPLLDHRFAARATLVLAIAVVALLMSGAQEPIAMVMLIHLAFLLFVSIVCHCELATRRPSSAHLTEFYLLLAVGGMLGGVFNALLAPVIFDDITEYPLLIVLACATCAWIARSGDQHMREVSGNKPLQALDVLAPIGLGALCAGLILIGEHLFTETPAWRVALLLAPTLLGCYLMSRRPLRFGLAIAAVLATNSLVGSEHGDRLMAERTFFGVHRVARVARMFGEQGETLGAHALYHGTTLHGEQRIDAATGEPSQPRSPMAYYHRDGPLGDILAVYGERAQTIGVVGLGTGALAAYGEPGQHYEFVEIDPLVATLATDPRYFTFLAEARERGVDISVTVDDARIALTRNDAQRFDLLILDAFSSDAIPMHLLTQEAIGVYLKTLKDKGLLVFHISNRHLDLAPVVTRLAAATGLVSAIRSDPITDASADRATLRRRSQWAVVTREAPNLNALAMHPRGGAWQVHRVDGSTRTWTDDYSNILNAIVW